MPDCPPLTAEELAELKAKWEAATQGEYIACEAGTGTLGYDLDPTPDGIRGQFERKEDAEAIAALHNAFPRFLATLAAKEAELAVWESAVEEMRAHLAAAVGSGEGTSQEGEQSQ